jgi:peptidoglycan/xylan/chitin deacetylase (PgdA/CDA1 family)
MRWLTVLLLFFLFVPMGAMAAEQSVAVTFDDLPFAAVPREDDAYLSAMTRKLMDGLRESSVPVVGFVNEKKLYVNGKIDQDRIELLRTWVQAGFDLGNHTYSHFSIDKISLEMFESDFLNGEIVSRQLMKESGRPLRWFRHPYLDVGKSNEEIVEFHNFLTARGYTIAPVTINSSEWIFAIAYVKAQGDMILTQQIGEAYISYMNDVFAWAEKMTIGLFGRPIPQVLLLHANSLNADYFVQLAAMIRKRGYRFVTLDEALKDPVYFKSLHVTGEDGESWLERWSREAGLRPPRPPSVPRFVLQRAGHVASSMDRDY